ncbi:MAG: 4Fe-4S binding protein, partial [Bacteroidales bacterium]|nr:4Fe-4S binding protein [Bacteroidales bacterium]
MKKLRITLEILFFGGITLLLSGLLPGAERWLGWMPKLQFLPSLLALNAIVIIALLALTICFGRIYCSVICPLGVMQDGISRISVLAKRARKNRKPFHFRKENKWLRYGIWVLFVAALIAGLQPL